MDLPYGMYDADNHLYETKDAFTRHLPAHRKRDLFWVTDERGHQHIIMGGKLWDYIPNPTFDPISKAGALVDMYSGEKSRDQVNTDGYRVVEPLALRPEYQDPAKRTLRLDAQGIDACLLFPTLASGIEELIREDIPLLMDVLWTFNRWMADVWTFNYQDRMYGAPMFALGDVDTAVRMLDWAIEQGVRIIDLRSSPVLTPLGFRSPADRMFDPFWARCEEAGVMIGIHAGPVNYTKYSGDWCGEYVWRAFAKTPFEHIANHGRPISDFLTAMITHGACTRFPGLKLISVENGGDWVPDLVKTMKLIHHRYPGGFPEDPIEVFERNVWVSPFWEDDLVEVAQFMPMERILAGSDFPHAEGLSEPTDFAKGLSSFSEADQRRIMRDNLAALVHPTA